MDQAVDAEVNNAAVHPIGCARCGRTLRRGWGFAFKVDLTSAGKGVATQLGEMVKCTLCALRHTPMLKRSLTVALVVGTILVLLNQGDTILAGNWKPGLYWKIPLTYLVPFCVATFGALTNSRR